MVGESQEPVGASVGGAQGGANKTPTLEEYGTNLTQQAEEVRKRMKSMFYVSAGFGVRCCGTHSMISCGGWQSKVDQGEVAGRASEVFEWIPCSGMKGLLRHSHLWWRVGQVGSSCWSSARD